MATRGSVHAAVGHVGSPSTATARVEVRMLGGFDVRVEGRTLPSHRWSRRHSAGLVKLLALAPGCRLHREQVIDALWPDLDMDRAAPRLHKAAHYARTAFGHRHAVVLDGDTVRLYPRGDVRIDWSRFQQHAESAIADGGVAAAKAALALYGGELLPHDLYEPWAEQARLHLGRLHTELLHQARDWHQILLTDPTDEQAHLALAERHLDRGDRAAALKQIDQLDAVLDLELGLGPSGRSKALRQRIAHGVPDRTCCPETSRASSACANVLV